MTVGSDVIVVVAAADGDDFRPLIAATGTD